MPSPDREEGEIVLSLPLDVARFLRGMVAHMNTSKVLPEDDERALQTSAWLEVIEARLALALARWRVPGE